MRAKIFSFLAIGLLSIFALYSPTFGNEKTTCQMNGLISDYPDKEKIREGLCHGTPQQIYNFAIKISEGIGYKQNYDVAYSLFLEASAKGISAATYQVYKLVMDDKIKSLKHVKEKYAIPMLKSAALDCYPPALKDYGFYILDEKVTAKKLRALSYFYQAQMKQDFGLDLIISSMEKGLSQQDISNAAAMANQRNDDCRLFQKKPE